MNYSTGEIKVTHVPTGIVIWCNGERSQHRNRANALQALKSKLYVLEQNGELTQITKLFSYTIPPDVDSYTIDDLTEYKKEIK